MDSLLFSLASASILLLTWRFGTPLDNFAYGLPPRLLARFREKPHPLAQAIASIQCIQGHLRAGLSLEGTLEGLVGADNKDTPTVSTAKKVLAGVPDGSALGAILAAGVQQGAPVGEALSGLKRAFASQLRSERKAKALTTQARMQGIIAGALPFLLFGAIAWIDSELLFAADRRELSISLLAAAAALDLAGVLWMRRMFRLAFFSSDPVARELETQLPTYLTSVIGKLAVGVDAASAYEQSLPPNAIAPALNSAIFAPPGARNPTLPHVLQQTLAARDRAQKLGAPIRTDLTEILADLESEREARWEEAAQALPIRMLLPLFACIFPANMSVLAIPVLPSILAF